jgi:SAM-dependent methyltransferase
MAREFGFSIGRYGLRLTLSRQPSADVVASRDRIALGLVKALERRFPELAKFDFPANTTNADAIAQFYVAYIPLIHPSSASAHLRSLLQRLIGNTADAAVKGKAATAIAISDLGDGLPDRAGILKGHPQHGDAWAQESDRFEAAYGANLVHDDWSRASRGQSLIAYFEAHPELLRGKSVLHFAPESELREWFSGAGRKTGVARYVTVDGFLPWVDLKQDITAMDGVATGSFDVVICHRVMEHVLDDAGGFSELYRVLRPGGLLSFSVPQAPQQAETREWVVPDESHDGHVRHYGVDLEQRMREAGFDVELEPWLLQQPADFLRAQSAYPMRIYNAKRGI